MIQCLVIDDEPVARSHMARLLSEHSDVSVVGQGANGLEGLQLVADCRPDVIFLDIEMPELSGLEMVAQLPNPPVIVFATAYDKYAVHAFEANAVDYLLKPIEPFRLAKAIEKVRATLAHPRGDYELLLHETMKSLRRGPPAKLAARRGKRIVLLSPREILYARIEDDIVFFHTATERYATDKTLNEVDELLSPAGFVRISRSTIVNLTHARELLPWSSGTWRLKLSNNAELEVSRERGRELKARIG